MKHYASVLTAILTFFTTLAFGQILNDDNAFFDYKYDKNIIKSNKVATVTIETFFSDGEKSGKALYYFNNEGLLTRYASLDSAGIVKAEYYFVTNSHKDLVVRIHKNYEYNKIDTVFFYKSYNRGKLIKDSSSSIPIGYNFEYDKNGKLLKTIINVSFGGNVKKIIINKLDSLGRITSIVETVYQNAKDSMGTQHSGRDIFYNNNGKIEKEVEKLNSEYSWMVNRGSVSYGYDNNGNLNEILRTSFASYSYNYNDKGLITSKKMSIKSEEDTDMLEIYHNYTGANKIEVFNKFIYTFRK